jgi:hypothetical protein
VKGLPPLLAPEVTWVGLSMSAPEPAVEPLVGRGCHRSLRKCAQGTGPAGEHKHPRELLPVEMFPVHASFGSGFSYHLFHEGKDSQLLHLQSLTSLANPFKQKPTQTVPAGHLGRQNLSLRYTEKTKKTIHPLCFLYVCHQRFYITQSAPA